MTSRLVKISALLVFSLLIFSLGGLAINTSPARSIPVSLADADPTPGETHIYKITTADFPLDIALDEENIDFTGNFVDSKIFVKILRNDSSPDIDDDTFQIGLFFVLGQNLTITIQPDHPDYDEIPPSLQEITIPSGIAVPMGDPLSWIVGSGVWYDDPELDSDDFVPIPFYAENFDALDVWLTANQNCTVVTDNDTEFEVLNEEEEDGETLTMTWVWRKSDGLLTKLSMTVTDGSTTVTGTAEYVETKNRPLPLTVGETYEFEVDVATLDIQLNDLLQEMLEMDDPDFDIDEIEADINTIEGKIIQEFTVNSIDGVFYNGTVKVWDAETESLKPLCDWIVVNGFSGDIVEDSDYFDDFEVGDFIPPAVTPDWELWSGMGDGFGQIIRDEIIPYLRSDAFKDEMLADSPSGTDVNIDFGLDWSEENSLYYISAFAKLDLKLPLVDDFGTKMGTVTAEGETEEWLAFQPSDGLVAGVGIIAKGKIKADIKGIGDWVGEIENLELTIVNPDVSIAVTPPEQPGGEEHPWEDEEGIPGFTFFAALLSLLAIPVIARRRSK